MSGALEAIRDWEFASLLEKFAPLSPTFAVAVSGGSDSMALAFCAHRWAQQNNHICIALIVDHALRPESAAEAAQVKTRLEKIGLRSEILHWEHNGVTSHIHEQARAARYRLLTEACRRAGATDLLIAHHREDQAETILMRLSKGSGVEGLAGMKGQSLRDDIRLVRPLLNVSKQQLIATCAAAKIDFVTDPSNASGKYARGRLRTLLPLLQQEGLTVDSLLDLGARAAEACDAMDHYTKEFLRTAAVRELGGSVRIHRAQLAQVPRAIALRALAFCLRHINDTDHPPEREALCSLLDAIMDTNNDSTRTFYGCLISLAPQDAIILREPAAASECLQFYPGTTLLWDKRWLIGGTIATPATGTLFIRALGTPAHEAVDLLAPRLRHDIPQGRIRATLPALWLGDVLYAIPSFDQKAAFRLSYRKQTFP